MTTLMLGLKYKGQLLFAQVDAVDVDLIRGYHWFAMRDHNTYYVCAWKWSSGKRTIVKMHNLLTGWAYVDHVDGDGLNNQRNNLREATHRQNMWNRGKFNSASSKYKGVHWHKSNKVWNARIFVDGKRVHLGSFRDEVIAAKAYDAAAREYFGEYARVNFS